MRADTIYLFGYERVPGSACWALALSGARTSVFDTRPWDGNRIRRARQAGHADVFHVEVLASALFSRFDRGAHAPLTTPSARRKVLYCVGVAGQRERRRLIADAERSLSNAARRRCLLAFDAPAVRTTDGRLRRTITARI
jgi:hypothetical protein